MFDVIGDINWIAIVLATIACSVLGGVWFAALFGKQYAKALGNDPNKKPVMGTVSYVGPMICNFVAAVASAILIFALGITSFGDGVLFGLIVGVGFVATTMLNVAINPNFPKPFAYAALNAPYFILCSIIISLIIIAFN